LRGPESGDVVSHIVVDVLALHKGIRLKDG
jgi:hypothetical protein